VTLGFVNFVVGSASAHSRSPSADVMLVKDMFSSPTTVYFSWYEIARLWSAGGVCSYVGLLWCCLCARPKLASACRTCFTFVALIARRTSPLPGLRAAVCRRRVHRDAVSDDLRDAYQDYGFAYTFINTFADMGISKPDRYSADTVDRHHLRHRLHHRTCQDGESLCPIIIFIQL
jgi:hypothetical protein